MNKLIQFVKQTSTVDVYDIDGIPNLDNPCRNGDWNYGSRTCGEDCVSYQCSGIAAEPTCGNIGTRVEGEWKTNLNGISESPIVQCSYYPDTFTLDDIDEYVNKFGKDEKYNTIVMPTFCFQDSTECVNNPETGEQWRSCPNMLNQGNIGVFCRNWRSNNIDDADQAQTDYCNDNSGNPTCSCYNRNNDEVYLIVSGDNIDECNSNNSKSTTNNLTNNKNPYNAGCWYKPCTLPTNYLVPSDLINDNPPCPPENQVCTEINNIIAASTSNLPQSVFQDKITCEITESPMSDPNSNGTGTGSSSMMIWIVLIVIFIIIIIIVIVVVIYYMY